MLFGAKFWVTIGASIATVSVGVCWFVFRYCSHDNISRPFPNRKNKLGHYVTCFKCGGEWDYDFKNMKRGARRDRDSVIATKRGAPGLGSFIFPCKERDR